jgi:hypothetical protein
MAKADEVHFATYAQFERQILKLSAIRPIILIATAQDEMDTWLELQNSGGRPNEVFYSLLRHHSPTVANNTSVFKFIEFLAKAIAITSRSKARGIETVAD